MGVYFEIKIEELLKFIDEQSEYIIKAFPCGRMDKETYARTVKLMEEVGELCSEILKIDERQRKREHPNHNSESLSGEFADVIITTLLLAKRMNVDIEKALERKIAKIIKRRN